jgi:glycosyltransferase involved in cell wall biosynthesis
MIDAVNMTPYYNASLCRALLAEQCQVTMITSPFIYDPWPVYHGTEVRYGFSHFLRNERLLQLAKKSSARRAMRMLEYPLDLMDVFLPTKRPRPILHFQWAAIPALDTWIWRSLKLGGYPLVLTVHNVVPHGSQRPSLAQERLYNIPHRIIVHTQSLAQELVERFPSTAERVRIIPHGTLFNDVPECSRDAARRSLGLPSDAPIALFFGLIEPYKGVDCLIRAFSQVAQDLPEARLLIAGKPNTPVERHRTLIAELGMSGSIRTDHAFIATERVPLYFGAADVVVLPYLEASQSGVLLAAYRFGRPVIVTATGGLPDTVEHLGNGLVVPPRNESALADALIELLSDRERASEMGGRSREIGLKCYNWRAIARQTMAVYRELGGD